jgi:hypothetical protein
MKKYVLFVTIACAIACGGCNNFQAKSEIAATIDTQGIAAFNAMVLGIPEDAVKIKADMQEDATLLSAYVDSATTNVWVYWFGGKKIYCSQAMYSGLEDFDAMSNEYLSNRLDTGTTENNAKQWRRNKAAIIVVRDWKIGGANSIGGAK